MQHKDCNGMILVNGSFMQMADNLMSFCMFKILCPILGNISKMDTPYDIRSPKIVTPLGSTNQYSIMGVYPLPPGYSVAGIEHSSQA